MAMFGLFFGCSKKSKVFTAKPIAYSINKDYLQISSYTASLAGSVSKLYPLPLDTANTPHFGKYSISEDGALYRSDTPDSSSALWVSGIVPYTDTVVSLVYASESLDSIFKRIQIQSPGVVQVYYNDRHSLNRIYPPFDVLSQYSPKMDIPSFNFYYLADLEHNPSKSVVWVKEPYVDPAGRGWMVSSIAPVYFENSLEGVVGLDVTVSAITERYLQSDSQSCAIITQTGVVAAADEKAISYLEMPSIQGHRYLDVVKQDTYKQEEFSVVSSHSQEVRDLWTIAKVAQDTLFTHILGFQVFNVEIAQIPPLQWTVLCLSPQ
jgi:hypothetical protein